MKKERLLVHSVQFAVVPEALKTIEILPTPDVALVPKALVFERVDSQCPPERLYTPAVVYQERLLARQICEKVPFLKLRL